MKLRYDPKYNIAYIALREKTEAVETLHISDELNIDMSSDGKISGIELLNANQQLQTDKNLPFTIINETSGLTREVSLG
jgi:uncharacterized protein YuzE